MIVSTGKRRPSNEVCQAPSHHPTRHSLRKKRNEEQFREEQVKIAEWVEKSELGGITPAYVDEAGLAQAQPNEAHGPQPEPFIPLRPSAESASMFSVP
ncbi:MAG: hypothetical protein KA223_01315 [Candidatus Accumulibacter sp.]|jgi:hypothetical protein|nr:hypothetical protein [Accumulibacter sp.]